MAVSIPGAIVVCGGVVIVLIGRARDRRPVDELEELTEAVEDGPGSSEELRLLE